MINKDFKEFVELLNAHRVEYMVVGGFALIAHGHVRYTGDIDFWVNPNQENAEKLVQCLKDYDVESLGISVADLTQLDQVIQPRFRS